MSCEIELFYKNLRRSLAESQSEQELIGSTSSTFKISAIREALLGKKVAGCTVLSRARDNASSSVVYRAKDENTQEVVTLRMLRMQLCCQPSNIRTFEKEARALSDLNHSNLMHVREIGRAFTGQPFMITDHCEGATLERIISCGGPIEWRRAVNLFCQVCDALQCAHDNGVVHGQLSPQCVLVSTSGGVEHVKVTDFAVGARALERQQMMSAKAKRALGAKGAHFSVNPAYLTPEQCSGTGVDPRTDIYALGTLMYECLTGKAPFSGKNDSEVMVRQLAEDPRSFKSLTPVIDVPGWLESIVLKALRKERVRRFRSMGELKSALQAGLKNALGDSKEVSSEGMAAFQANESQNEENRLIGQVIGNTYTVQSFIGGGGMSMVYKAVQKGTDRVVAVKLLRSDLCDSPAAVKRFEREAKSLGRVTHPNLIAIFDVGKTAGDQPYMVTEFLDGESLKQMLEKDGALELGRALKAFIQVCDVMEFTHRKGIIHRDLKPANIMLVNQGGHNDVVKVVDFGIVKLDENIMSVSQKLTASGEICGSPMYMSPEQILDDPLDARTDIYSLGTVMFEVFAGQPLFAAKKITEVMNKHVKVVPPSLSSVCTDKNFPSLLDDAVAICLEKRPEQRFQSMGELKDVLMRIEADLNGTPSTSHVDLARVSGRAKTLSARAAQTNAANEASHGLPSSEDKADPATGNTRLRLIAMLAAVIVLTAVVSVGLTLLVLNSNLGR